MKQLRILGPVGNVGTTLTVTHRCSCRQCATESQKSILAEFLTPKHTTTAPPSEPSKSTPPPPVNQQAVNERFKNRRK